MPDIVLPPPFPYTDGSVLDSSDVGDNLFSPTGGPVSLEVVNGRLDNTNRSVVPGEAWKLTTDHIQHGALSGGQSVGATANLDFFKVSMGGWDKTTGPDSLLIPISGGGVSFYLPYQPSFVLLSWIVSYANSDSTGPGTVTSSGAIQMTLNGTLVAGHRIDMVSAGTGGAPRDGKEWDRTWTGIHRTVPPPDVNALDQGWHNVSLRTSSEYDHIRIRVRSFTVVYFR